MEGAPKEKMKKNKISLYLNDETMEALDTIAQSYDYYKYPKEQAYGLIMDALVREIQTLSLFPYVSSCPASLYIQLGLLSVRRNK